MKGLFRSLKLLLISSSLIFNILALGFIILLGKTLNNQYYYALNKNTWDRVVTKMLKGKEIVVYKDRVITKDKIQKVYEKVYIDKDLKVTVPKFGVANKLNLLYSTIGWGIGYDSWFFRDFRFGFSVNYRNQIQPGIYLTYANPIRFISNTSFHIGRGLDDYFAGVGIRLN